MHVLLINNSKIPVYSYGGTERVIWDLGKSLAKHGHKVSYLVPEDSSCDFGSILPINPQKSWQEQIPDNIDIAHFQFNPHVELSRPYLVTEHGNARKKKPLPRNTVFLSQDHAHRYGSNAFVYNGLDWDNYGEVDFSIMRKNYHFLGKAAWSVKNVKGAIQVAKLARVNLDVLGGDRFQMKRGFRFTFSRHIHFHGMVGGQEKFKLLNSSKGMIFPVRWHEPFGLAIIESLYFGCPVFATPYGAIPELVPEYCGKLSTDSHVLAQYVKSNDFSNEACHEHAKKNFNSDIMTSNYIKYYKKVMAGESINKHQPVIITESRNLPWK